MNDQEKAQLEAKIKACGELLIARKIEEFIKNEECLKAEALSDLIKRAIGLKLSEKEQLFTSLVSLYGKDMSLLTIIRTTTLILKLLDYNLKFSENVLEEYTALEKDKKTVFIENFVMQVNNSNKNTLQYISEKLNWKISTQNIEGTNEQKFISDFLWELICLCFDKNNTFPAAIEPFFSKTISFNMLFCIILFFELYNCNKVKKIDNTYTCYLLVRRFTERNIPVALDEQEDKDYDETIAILSYYLPILKCNSEIDNIMHIVKAQQKIGVEHNAKLQALLCYFEKIKEYNNKISNSLK